MPISDVQLLDCMEGMKHYPDKFFDLAIVDPPYGIGFSDYERGGSGVKVKERYTKNGKKKWDSEAPEAAYFKELCRVSKHQIIWGGNYFLEHLGSSKGMICWYKHQPVPNFSDCEFAWNSIDKPAKVFDFRYYGNLEGKSSTTEKVHPTQKPVALYKWLLSNYAKEGDKILDTHLGSGSSRIAAYVMGFDFWGFEIDQDYFLAQEKRFKEQTAQQSLFEYHKTA